MKKGDRTPWGTADHVKRIAPGIYFVGTPSHGGYKLDRKRNAVVHPMLRRKGGWYEEDVDYAIVWFSFPDTMYTNRPVQEPGILATIRNVFPDAYTAVTGEVLTIETSRALRERDIAKRHENDLLVISAWGDWHDRVPNGMVGVFATLGGQRTEEAVRAGRWFLIPIDAYNDFHVKVVPSGAKPWENHA